MTFDQKKAWLNHTFSKIAGVQTVVAIRGDRDFTFMFEGEDYDAAKRVIDFFLGDSKCESSTVFADDCDATFLYVNNVSLMGA